MHDLRLSNYGAVDEQVLFAISRLTYDETVSGLCRLARRSYTEVLALSAEGEQMAAQLRDLHSGQIETERYDFTWTAAALIGACRGADQPSERISAHDEPGRSGTR